MAQSIIPHRPAVYVVELESVGRSLHRIKPSQFLIRPGFKAGPSPLPKFSLSWLSCVNVAFKKNVVSKAVSVCRITLKVFVGYPYHETIRTYCVVGWPNVPHTNQEWLKCVLKV